MQEIIPALDNLCMCLLVLLGIIRISVLAQIYLIVAFLIFLIVILKIFNKKI
jgi:purine-cytosine permease-like protein